MIGRFRSERGSITIWIVGLCVMVLFLGGIGVDLWRGISIRRELSSMATAAAAAGASGLDEAQLRAGILELDPGLANDKATLSLNSQPGRPLVDAVAIAPTPAQITVTVTRTIDVTLLGIFLPGEELQIQASATAEPRFFP